MSLDPDRDAMRRLGADAAGRIADHLAGLSEARVFAPPSRDVLANLTDETLPLAGSGLDDCLARFFDVLLPHATLVNHPRFFGWVPAPGSFAGALGAFAASASNLFVGTWLGGAIAAQLEVTVIDWLRQALGLPDRFAGGLLTSGGSLANLDALAAARARARARGKTGFRVYVTREAHYSVDKAARVIGVPADDVVVVDVDDAQRLRTASLARALAQDAAAGREPGVVVVTMGTTTTGAVDPIAEAAALASRHGAWLHVDGAYGAALAILPERGDLRDALACADSITLDPHKGLYAPFECGCLLVTDLAALRAAFVGDAAYLQDVPRDEVNFFERGPELSRGARAVPLWFVLRGLGLAAIRDALRADVANAQRAAAALARDSRFVIVTPPSTTVFTFTVAGGEPRARELLRRIHADGSLLLSSSRVGETFVLRFCVLNHRTDGAEIDRAVAKLIALLDAC